MIMNTMSVAACLLKVTWNEDKVYAYKLHPGICFTFRKNLSYVVEWIQYGCILSIVVKLSPTEVFSSSRVPQGHY